MPEIKSKIVKRTAVLFNLTEYSVHYRRVVVSLRETIRLMGEVDGVIDVNGGWPVK